MSPIPARLFFGGLVFVALGAWSIREEISFRDKSIVDTAVILPLHDSGGFMSTRNKFLISYTSSDGTEQSTVIDKEDGQEDLGEGDQVEIRYDPDNPGAKATSNGPLWHQEKRGIYEIVVGAAFSAIGLFMMSTRRR